LHVIEPKANTRAAIKPLTTRADALSALELLAHGEDQDLAMHLVGSLREFISAV
jgi:hypothetical protein